MATTAGIEHNINELQDVLEQVIEKNVGKESTIMKVITLDILSQTVKNTRVDTGALRNNWQVSRNLRNKTDVKSKNYDKTGRRSISKGKRVTATIRATDIIYIQNNLDYAETYERKDKMLQNAIKKVTRDLSNGR